jgi:hypothetical protein
VDGTPLKTLFSRLFYLCLDKDRSLANMYRLGSGFHGNGWRWRRRLFALEEELWGECCGVLANVLLQVDPPDEWEWLPDINAGYSVSGAYQILTHQNSTGSYSHCELVWYKLVPLKVSTFVWRFLYNRLPTKFNLYDRGFLHNDSILCSAGCIAVEDVHHLFLKCPIFGAVWNGIISWLGVSCVLPDNAIALASQFCGAHSFGKSIRSCFQAIWLATV